MTGNALAATERPKDGWLLFEHAPEPLWLVRLDDLQLLEVNRAAIDRFGFTRRQYLAMRMTDFHSESDIGRLRSALRGTDPSSNDLRGWKTRDVGQNAVDTDLSLSFLDWEGVPCILVCPLDMTARKTLEERVRQAGKMEAIGMLAGGIAHDFNNLLTIISGYSQLLLNAVPESERVSIEQILRASERAAQLTGQLLAFSRRQELQPQALNVNTIVTGMSTMLRRLIGEHIELKLSLSNDLCAIHADPGHVNQIIMNLVVNARDAMANGGTLTVETQNQDVDASVAEKKPGLRAGPYVTLSVTDTGVGMDQKTKARVFDPFFTTKEKGAGTGLGLSTVQSIAKQTGGTVSLESEPGLGTTVHVLFPTVGDVSLADPGAAKASEIDEERGNGETILVVEDEDAVRRLVRATLERRGYRVLVASGGAEAIQVAQGSHDIDLVLTDLIMPQMSGVEVAQEIQQMRPEVKVLFMSGYTDRSLQKTATLPEHAEFLQKPFTPQVLAKCVREALDRDGNADHCATATNP